MNLAPKVSIIVPLYNCGKYLPQIISDVFRQTEQSFELILCDDGSTDNTISICESYLARDNRIRLIKNQHRGVSATRNSGIKKARGEWVTFVDADDSLLPNFLDSLISYKQENTPPN